MCDTSQPSWELTVFIVASLLNGDNGFCESFLKDVFRQFFITHRIIDVRIKTIFIAVQQNIECLVIALCIKGH